MSEKYITAFAPASIGNIAVGFDMLGLAITGVGDRVSARRVTEEGVIIKEIYDLNNQPHNNLSKDPSQNTASIAASALWRAERQVGGIELIIHKGIPLQSGMGSSAASAVAGALAANGLLERPLTLPELLPAALEGEEFASGGIHADNVAPSLIGGMVFCPSTSLPDMVSIDTPKNISSVLIHPDLVVNTAESRGSLLKSYLMSQWLEQQSHLAGFLIGLQKNDLALIRENLRDVIIEPQRANSVAYFDDVKNAAITAGALGCSLSGSGPSIFALCEDRFAETIKIAMMEIFTKNKINSQGWVSSLNANGAYLEN